MAIAFDVGTGITGSTSPVTGTHTVTNSLTNSILIVSIGHNGNTITVTGVTYNGVAMTALSRTSGGGTARVETFYMLNPPSGSALTVSAALSSNTAITMIAASYQGVDQSTPLDGVTVVGSTVLANSSAISNSITPNSANAWVVDFLRTAPSGSWAAGGSQTSDKAISDGSANHSETSHRAVVSPASTTMSWTFTSSSGGDAQQLIVLKPFVATGKLSSYGELDGMGGMGQTRFNRIR